MNRENALNYWQILKQSIKCSNECFCCSNAASGMLCELCFAGIERFCPCMANGRPEAHYPLNSMPEIKKAVPELTPYKLVIVGPHKGLLKICISAFKYNDKPLLAQCLGKLMVDCINHGYDDIPLPEAVVPVPMHPYKLARRGFNQTVLLGEALQKQVPVELRPNLLRVNKMSNPQVTKDAKARRQPVQNNISLAPDTDLRELHHLALLDDVITTGSTMNQLVKLLEAANPNLRIDLWSLSISLPH